MQLQPSKQLPDLSSAKTWTHTLRLGRRLPIVAMSNKCQRQLVGLRSALSKKQYNEKEVYSAGKFAVIAG
jgi:hypothetical protein